MEVTNLFLIYCRRFCDPCVENLILKREYCIGFVKERPTRGFLSRVAGAARPK